MGRAHTEPRSAPPTFRVQDAPRTGSLPRAHRPQAPRADGAPPSGRGGLKLRIYGKKHRRLERCGEMRCAPGKGSRDLMSTTVGMVAGLSPILAPQALLIPVLRLVAVRRLPVLCRGFTEVVPDVPA